MNFKELGLVEPILKSLKNQGYVNPTPIQEQAIPILLKGKDLLGCAQTGTGKTAAFGIPILQHIFNNKNNQQTKPKIKALIVTPTRELAIQIADNLTAYAKYTSIRNTVIFGGVKQGAQTKALSRGVDILVATPGRLLDLMEQGFISLKYIEYFVLDEADHMLDMGFINPIKRILRHLPQKRQSLFFSATMPNNIVSLSREILGNYERVTIQPKQATAERVEQAVYFVTKSNKSKLLLHLLENESKDTTLIFSRTKHGADKIVKILKRSDIMAEAIHGNKSQNARQRALSNFKNGSTKVLVATDIAARGIDVSDLSLVINYDLPNVPETYVHRIGRTGRASASGIAVSFCNVEERPYLRSIQKLINQDISVVNEHPFPDDAIEDAIGKKKATKSNPTRNKRNNQRRSKSRNKQADGSEGNRRNNNWRRN